MARPRTVTDEELLAVAQDCFLEHGPAVSTQLIAQRLGLSQAAIFKRFGTKEELLFAAMMPRGPTPWMLALEEGPDERPIPDQLTDIGLQITAFMRKLVPCLSVLKESGVSHVRALGRLGGEPPPVRTHRLLSQWLAQAQAQGRVRACDPAALAFTYMGAIHGRQHMRHLAGAWLPESDDEEFVHLMVELLWRGMRPDGEV